MKPYGNTRAQNLTCVYGCCTSGRVNTKHRKASKASKRASKKAARQANKIIEQ